MTLLRVSSRHRGLFKGLSRGEQVRPRQFCRNQMHRQEGAEGQRGVAGKRNQSLEEVI